jgi:hypothetical protein
MSNSQHMLNSIIVLASFAIVVLYAYFASAYQSRKRRMRRWEKQRKTMQAKGSPIATSFYEEPAREGKFQKKHTWELHETI